MHAGERGVNGVLRSLMGQKDRISTHVEMLASDENTDSHAG